MSHQLPVTVSFMSLIPYLTQFKYVLGAWLLQKIPTHDQHSAQLGGREANRGDVPLRAGGQHKVLF